MKEFRSWHPGQLTTAWIGVLLTDRILVAVFHYNADKGREVNDFWAGLYVLIALAITGTMLWISWHWFENR